MKQHHFSCRTALALLMVSLSVAGTCLAAPMELSLQDSIKLSLQNNAKLKIAIQSKEKTLWTIRQAQSYKNVDLSYSFTGVRGDTPPSWLAPDTFTTLPTTVATNPVTGIGGVTGYTTVKTFNYSDLSIYNNYTNQFSLVLPVYTGGKVESMIEQAKSGSKVADLNILAVKQQLTLEATIAYFHVLQARNMLAIARQTVDDLAQHLINVQSHYDAGTVALPDLLQTQVRLANSQDGLIKAQNAYELSMYALNNVMGLPLKNELRATDEFVYQPYPLSLDDCIARAAAQRPELLAAGLNVSINQQQITVAKSDKLPTISLFGTQSWDSEKSNSIVGDYNDNHWMVGANLTMDLFDGQRTESLIKQAETGVSIAKDQLQKAKDDISLEVSSYYLSMKEAEKRLETNEVAVNEAQTNLALTKQRYEAGIGTNLDVIDAELALDRSKTIHVQALYDYNTSKAQLQKAMGADNN
jgi:outer membrane protein TolC